MTDLKTWIVDGALAVWVTPNAKRERIVVEGDRVRVYVTVPPEGGRANARVCALVARELGLARGAVVLESGTTARAKRLRVVQD